MKRIKAACLEQTVHFLPKDELPDGSLLVKLKKQYNAYDCPPYMD